uniref:Si:ch211-226m7.4 n=1 Tax=Dicentrarchus labrax TaxID=13489 RepID=A0A8P4GKE8_DICLA
TNQAGMAQDKWTQTGWRIEQKYANKVLLGNWAEERLQVGILSAYCLFHFYSSQCIQAMSRLLCIVFQGLPSKLLFAHRDPPSSHYLVTQYQESYGHKHTNTLPTLRRWHPHSLTWQPERSDRPISAIPTNFGPLQSTKHRLEKPQPHLPSLTVYRSEYQRHPLSTFCQSRFARASRMLSSHLHAANHSNKDLDLRRCSLLQIPDPRFSLRPQSQQAHRQHCGS